MTEHYCTLFDAGFLPQALALHSSLMRHGGDFKLWALCMDEGAEAALGKLALPRVAPIPLRDVETPALLEVKKNRSRGEYCWTLTPFLPSIVFTRDPSVSRVTYVDADLYFLNSPRPIFAEFERSNKQILITDHAYAPEYDISALSGQFCVQFVIFCRGGSEATLAWWQERCIEWCFAKHEDGKFGDQKYLDDWPVRFEAIVHVLEKTHAILGPWNASRFPIGSAVAFHFHGVRFLSESRLLMWSGYTIPPATRDVAYKPYVLELKRAVTTLREIGIRLVAQRSKRSLRHNLRALKQSLLRHLWRLQLRKTIPLN
jgi:hypothetical protein